MEHTLPKRSHFSFIIDEIIDVSIVVRVYDGEAKKVWCDLFDFFNWTVGVQKHFSKLSVVHVW